MCLECLKLEILKLEEMQVFPLINVSEINNMYSGQYEYFQNDSIDYEDFYSESDSYLSLTEEGGSTIGYGGSLKYIFNYQDERKNDGFGK